MNESSGTQALTASGLPPVHTTKILGMGHLVSSLTAEQRRAVGAKEVPATVRLYLAGKIDQWWYRQDGKRRRFSLQQRFPGRNPGSSRIAAVRTSEVDAV